MRGGLLCLLLIALVALTAAPAAEPVRIAAIAGDAVEDVPGAPRRPLRAGEVVRAGGFLVVPAGSAVDLRQGEARLVVGPASRVAVGDAAWWLVEGTAWRPDDRLALAGPDGASAPAGMLIVEAGRLLAVAGEPAWLLDGLALWRRTCPQPAITVRPADAADPVLTDSAWTIRFAPGLASYAVTQTWVVNRMELGSERARLTWQLPLPADAIVPAASLRLDDQVQPVLFADNALAISWRPMRLGASHTIAAAWDAPAPVVAGPWQVLVPLGATDPAHLARRRLVVDLDLGCPPEGVSLDVPATIAARPGGCRITVADASGRLPAQIAIRAEVPAARTLVHHRGTDSGWILGADARATSALPPPPRTWTLLVDTSAGVDAEARAMQAAWIAGLAARLDDRHRLRVAACDAELAWIQSQPIPPSAIGPVLAAVQRRTSLGWMDPAVLAPVDGDEVVYLGPGRWQAPLADGRPPSVWLERLATLPRRGRWHAVGCGGKRGVDPSGLIALARGGAAARCATLADLGGALDAVVTAADRTQDLLIGGTRPGLLPGMSILAYDGPAPATVALGASDVAVPAPTDDPAVARMWAVAQVDALAATPGGADAAAALAGRMQVVTAAIAQPPPVSSDAGMDPDEAPASAAPSQVAWRLPLPEAARAVIDDVTDADGPSMNGSSGFNLFSGGLNWPDARVNVVLDPVGVRALPTADDSQPSRHDDAALSPDPRTVLHSERAAQAAIRSALADGDPVRALPLVAAAGPGSWRGPILAAVRARVAGTDRATCLSLWRRLDDGPDWRRAAIAADVPPPATEAVGWELSLRLAAATDDAALRLWITAAGLAASDTSVPLADRCTLLQDLIETEHGWDDRLFSAALDRVPVIEVTPVLADGLRRSAVSASVARRLAAAAALRLDGPLATWAAVLAAGVAIRDGGGLNAAESVALGDRLAGLPVPEGRDLVAICMQRRLAAVLAALPGPAAAEALRRLALRPGPGFALARERVLAQTIAHGGDALAWCRSMAATFPDEAACWQRGAAACLAQMDRLDEAWQLFAAQPGDPGPGWLSVAAPWLARRDPAAAGSEIMAWCSARLADAPSPTGRSVAALVADWSSAGEAAHPWINAAILRWAGDPTLRHDRACDERPKLLPDIGPGAWSGPPPQPVAPPLPVVRAVWSDLADPIRAMPVLADLAEAAPWREAAMGETIGVPSLWQLAIASNPWEVFSVEQITAAIAQQPTLSDRCRLTKCLPAARAPDQAGPAVAATLAAGLTEPSDIAAVVAALASWPEARWQLARAHVDQLPMTTCIAAAEHGEHPFDRLLELVEQRPADRAAILAAATTRLGLVNDPGVPAVLARLVAAGAAPTDLLAALADRSACCVAARDLIHGWLPGWTAAVENAGDRQACLDLATVTAACDGIAAADALLRRVVDRLPDGADVEAIGATCERVGDGPTWPEQWPRTMEALRVRLRAAIQAGAVLPCSSDQAASWLGERDLAETVAGADLATVLVRCRTWPALWPAMRQRAMAEPGLVAELVAPPDRPGHDPLLWSAVAAAGLAAGDERWLATAIQAAWAQVRPELAEPLLQRLWSQAGDAEPPAWLSTEILAGRLPQTPVPVRDQLLRRWMLVPQEERPRPWQHEDDPRPLVLAAARASAEAGDAWAAVLALVDLPHILASDLPATDAAGLARLVEAWDAAVARGRADYAPLRLACAESAHALGDRALALAQAGRAVALGDSAAERLLYRWAEDADDAAAMAAIRFAQATARPDDGDFWRDAVRHHERAFLTADQPDDAALAAHRRLITARVGWGHDAALAWRDVGWLLAEGQSGWPPAWQRGLPPLMPLGCLRAAEAALGSRTDAVAVLVRLDLARLLMARHDPGDRAAAAALVARCEAMLTAGDAALRLRFADDCALLAAEVRGP
jgi:hypothetical protein